MVYFQNLYIVYYFYTFFSISNMFVVMLHIDISSSLGYSFNFEKKSIYFLEKKMNQTPDYNVAVMFTVFYAKSIHSAFNETLFYLMDMTWLPCFSVDSDGDAGATANTRHSPTPIYQSYHS